MKKLLLMLVLMFVMLPSLCFAGYLMSDQDESDSLQKIYGTQLSNTTGWKGIEITSYTTRYNQGVTTTTYTSWWNVRKATTTIYYNGFDYKKHIYPN